MGDISEFDASEGYCRRGLVKGEDGVIGWRRRRASLGAVAGGSLVEGRFRSDSGRIDRSRLGLAC